MKSLLRPLKLTSKLFCTSAPPKFSRTAESLSICERIDSMTPLHISDTLYQPSSKTRSIYYVPLTAQDYAFLKHFSKETASFILKAGRAALYWEVLS